MLSDVYGLRLLVQPAGRRAVLLVVLGTVVAFRAFQFAGLVADAFWAADFGAYWHAAQRLLAELPIYQEFQLAGEYIPEGQLAFLYPPPFAVFVVPFVLGFPSGYGPAGFAWSLLGALLLIASVVAVAGVERLDERLRWPLPATWVLVVLAFVFTPVIGELSVGNVHMELLALLSLAWVGLRRGDGGGKVLAGAAIGAATLLKIFPGLLIIWLLFRRDLRPVAWATGTMAVIALATLPIVGLQNWLDYARALSNMGPITHSHDSVSATVWLAPYLGFDVARWSVLAVGVVLVIWAALRRDVRVGFALAVTISVLVAPSVFHHYLTLLLLPLLLALAAGVPLKVVGLSYLLLMGGQQPALGEWSWVLSRVPQTLGWLVLLVALAVRRRDDAPGEPAAGEPAPAVRPAVAGSGG